MAGEAQNLKITELLHSSKFMPHAQMLDLTENALKAKVEEA
jgi:hypothetical protein